MSTISLKNTHSSECTRYSVTQMINKLNKIDGTKNTQNKPSDLPKIHTLGLLCLIVILHLSSQQTAAECVCVCVRERQRETQSEAD